MGRSTTTWQSWLSIASALSPLKKVLLRDYGLATHWSGTHDGYASCIAYGYVPSKKKPLAELDPTPELWAAVGEHPPLAEASRAPVTAKALGKLLHEYVECMRYSAII